MYRKVIDSFQNAANPELAVPMKAYMKNQFEFFGIKSPQRAELSRPLYAECKKLNRDESLTLAGELWNLPQRELHYFAQEMLDKNLKKKWQNEDIEFLEWLVLHNSWWDTIDFIAPKLMKSYFDLYPEERIKKTKEWIKSGNIWLIRSAILIQLKTKEKTDFDLLFDIILKVNQTKEFFIDKAIGWVLRENAKHCESIVLQFIEKNRSKLSKLSEKEALKHFPNLL